MTVIAIDGPAGSGKSTLAAALARRLAVPHVDTGAIYRAATLAVLRSGVDVREGAACARVIAEAPIARVSGRTCLAGEDVEDEIRGPAVTAAVSAVSAHQEVREVLMELQRGQVGPTGAVVEGRDAGTRVVPYADLKVWLTAEPIERARRRALEQGVADPGAVAAQAADLQRRDAQDSAQMARAPEAVVVDTTGRDVDDIVEELVGMVAERSAG
jgi:cytidylate kinase